MYHVDLYVCTINIYIYHINLFLIHIQLSGQFICKYTDADVSKVCNSKTRDMTHREET